jgi:hypothetical protein
MPTYSIKVIEMKRRVVLISIILLSIVAGGVYIKYQLKIKELREAEQNFDTEWLLRESAEVPIKNKYNILVIANEGAEWQVGTYILTAAKQLGWTAKLIKDSIIGHEKEVLQLKPDFVLYIKYGDGNLYKDLIFLPQLQNTKHYFFISIPIASYSRQAKMDLYTSKTHRRKEEAIKELLTFADGFLKTSKGSYAWLEEKARRLGKPFYAIPWYPSPISALKQSSVEPKRLMYSGYNWDDLRSSDRYKSFYKLLANGVSAIFYGPKESWAEIGNAWGGYLSTESYIKAIQDNGICLILNSNLHLQSEAPSARPFEAAANKCLMISDGMPFVKEHFGDSVLYIDHTKSAQEMYDQVKAHLDWIKAHPTEARKMVEKAHEIFLEKFDMGKQLKNIAHLHEKILLDERQKANKDK